MVGNLASDDLFDFPKFVTNLQPIRVEPLEVFSYNEKLYELLNLTRNAHWVKYKISRWYFLHHKRFRVLFISDS